MHLSTPDNSRTLFKCSCLDGHGCDHSLELESFDHEYWLHVVSYPTNLLSCLRWWWEHRKVWRADLILTKDDLTKFREILAKL